MKSRTTAPMTTLRVVALVAVGALLAVAAACSDKGRGGSADTGAAISGTVPVGLAAGVAKIADGEVVTGPIDLDCSTERYGMPSAESLPAEYDPDDYKGSSARSAALSSSRHNLCGQKGDGTDLAWGITSGRPDVTIAITDSGMKFRDKKAMADLADKIALNPGELPTPQDAAGHDFDAHDRNGDGAVDMSDYSDDPRVSDRNDNGVRDPEDLILDPVFSDGRDDDRNGYVDDIAGWDFLHDDNDPNDDVGYGHGTGEALDSTAAANGEGDVGTCPHCHVVPMMVGDSFIADSGRFAAATFLAIDLGVDVVQVALGAYDNPSVAQASIDAATAAGIPVVASMADEQSSHPNLPAALTGTIAVNSVQTNEESPLPLPEGYLGVNGCTNTGGYIWVSVPSNSCSSEATGRAAGIVGLIESAARDAGIPPHPSVTGAGRKDPAPNVLSATEVAQVLRLTADDIDFGSAVTASADGKTVAEPADDVDVAPGTRRFPTTPGWDATSGYGRLNAFEAVKSVRAGSVPPEARLDSPRFDELFGVTGEVDVDGFVAAVRSSAFSWSLEWADGLQPPTAGAKDRWTRVAGGDDVTRSIDGRLGTLDLSDVAARRDRSGPPTDPEGLPDPDHFAVRIRLVVTDAEGRRAVDQRVVHVHDDPTLTGPWPRTVAGAGMASPVIADLDGDGTNELIVATDDGVLHAFTRKGGELKGWPVTSPLAAYWHPDAPSVKAAKVDAPHAAFGVGAPVVTDLDGDGSMEVVATSLEGDVSVWAADGELRPGFEISAVEGRSVSAVHIDPAYSEGALDSHNRTKRQIIAQPAVADLDSDGRQEIVVAAMDRHLYAWHDDGTAVTGFPLLIADPATVASVDPTTHRITYVDGVKVADGGELTATPAIGDLDGDGKPEIVVGAQEEYDGDLAVSPKFAIPGSGGNSRVYAVSPSNPAQPFLPGWPKAVPMLQTELLPSIGNGVALPARIADVDGDGANEVVVTSAAGPAMVFEDDGSSSVGTDNGLPSALPWTGIADTSAMVSAFGGPGVGDLEGDGIPDVVMPVVNDRRAIDQLMPDSQEGSATMLMAWSGASFAPLAGFPRRTSDLAFFVAPVVADVDGDGRNEAVAGNGVSMLDAFGASDSATGQPEGWPKLTGGWVVTSPAIGDLDGKPGVEIAVTRRDGTLLVWHGTS